MIASTVGSVLRARDRYCETRRDGAAVEVIVVDNASDDGTADALARHTAEGGVLMATCTPRGAARRGTSGAAGERPGAGLPRRRHPAAARSARPDRGAGRRARIRGGDHSPRRAGRRPAGPLLVGLLERRAAAPPAAGQGDAGLHVLHPRGFRRVRAVRRARRHRRGVADPGRALPRRPRRFVYDQAITALSSGRRMELQHFGYTRTFARYVWAILSFRGRVNYPDHVRHAPRDWAPGD